MLRGLRARKAIEDPEQGHAPSPFKSERCTKCQKRKSVASFCKARGNKSGLSSWCRRCLTACTLAARRRNPGLVRAELLRRKYGLTPERYLETLQHQDGVCAICRKPDGSPSSAAVPLAVDHCHRTSAVRGLLCRKCNTVLGMVDDNPEILERAIAYLKHYAEPTIAEG